jgi:hypothetical protein
MTPKKINLFNNCKLQRRLKKDTRQWKDIVDDADFEKTKS